MVSLFSLNPNEEVEPQQRLPTPSTSAPIRPPSRSERTLTTEGPSKTRQELAIEQLQKRQESGPPIPFNTLADQPPKPPTPEQIRAAEVTQRDEFFKMGGSTIGSLGAGIASRGNPALTAAGGVAGGVAGLAFSDSVTAIEDFTNFRDFFSAQDPEHALATLGSEYLEAAKIEAYYNFGGPVIFKVAGAVLKYPVTKLFGIAKNQWQIQQLLRSAENISRPDNTVDLALFNTPSTLARFYSKVLGIFPLVSGSIRTRFTKQAGQVQTAAEDFLNELAPIVQVGKLGFDLLKQASSSVKAFSGVSNFFYKQFYETAKRHGDPRMIPTVMFRKAITQLLESPNQLPNIPAFKNLNFVNNVERRTVTLQKRQLLLERRAARLASKEDVSQVDLEILELDNALKVIDDDILALKITQGPEGLEAPLPSLAPQDKGDRIIQDTLGTYLQLPEFISATEYRAITRELNRVARKAGKGDDFLLYVSTALRDGIETDLQNLARGFAPFRLSEIGLTPKAAKEILQSLSDANDFFVRGKAIFNSTAGKSLLKAKPGMFRPGFTDKIPTVTPENLANKMVDDPNFRSKVFIDELEDLINFGQEAAQTVRKSRGKGPGPLVNPPSEEYFSRLTRLYIEKQISASVTDLVEDKAGRQIAFVRADALENLLGIRGLGGIGASIEAQSQEFLTALFEKTGKSISFTKLRDLIDITRAIFESPVSDPAIFAVRKVTLQGLREPGNFFANMQQVVVPTMTGSSVGKSGIQGAATAGGVGLVGWLNFGVFLITVRS